MTIHIHMAKTLAKNRGIIYIAMHNMSYSYMTIQLHFKYLLSLILTKLF